MSYDAPPRRVLRATEGAVRPRRCYVPRARTIRRAAGHNESLNSPRGTSRSAHARPSVRNARSRRPRKSLLTFYPHRCRAIAWPPDSTRVRVYADNPFVRWPTSRHTPDRTPRRFDPVPLDPSASTGTNVTSPRRRSFMRSSATSSNPFSHAQERRGLLSPGSSSVRSAPILSAVSWLMDSCVFLLG